MRESLNITVPLPKDSPYAHRGYQKPKRVQPSIYDDIRSLSLEELRRRFGGQFVQDLYSYIADTGRDPRHDAGDYEPIQSDFVIDLRVTWGEKQGRASLWLPACVTRPECSLMIGYVRWWDIDMQAADQAWGGMVSLIEDIIAGRYAGVLNFDSRTY